MNYKQYILSKGGKELGLLYLDIKQHLLTPAQYDKFCEYMKGQTVCGIGSETIVYTGDFERFIKGLPIID